MWRIYHSILRGRVPWAAVKPATQPLRSDTQTDIQPVQRSCFPDLIPQRGDGSRRRESGDRNDGGYSHWSEWLRSFRRDFQTDRNQYSLLEAVGWGTAMVVGLHLSHFLHWKEATKRRVYDDLRLRHCHFSPLAVLAMPGPPTTAQKVLSGSPKLEATFSKSQEQKYKQTELGEDRSASSSNNAEEDKFAVAAKELENLCLHYTKIEQNATAYNLAKEGQFTKAVSLWKEASQAGYSKADYNLGLCYELGNGVKKSLQQAVEYYRQAADKGHAKATYNLAIMYLKGAGGLHKDSEKALQLLQLASDQGLQQAQTQLGVLYTEGYTQDLEKAVSLFQMGADKQDDTSQYYLGLCYEHGLGVEMDKSRADELYREASQSGHQGARESLAAMQEEKMNDEQTNRALDDKSSSINIQTDNKTSSKSNLTSSASSPTFTEYLRDQLMDFGSGDFGNTDFSSLRNTSSSASRTLRMRPGDAKAVLSLGRFPTKNNDHLKNETVAESSSLNYGPGRDRIEFYIGDVNNPMKGETTSGGNITGASHLNITASCVGTHFPHSKSSQDLRTIACT